MNLSNFQRKMLGWGVLAVVITIITLVLGVTFPIPAAPDAGDELTPLGTMYIRNLTVQGNELIDGAADAIQLVVQGHSTQTSYPNLFVVESSNGTDQFSVTNAGNIYAAGTSDLRGNVSDGGGTFTVADNTQITGIADSIQLLVTGYTTQTTSLFVLENSGGTDQLTVSNAGALFVNGTSDLRGNVSDGGGTFTIADDIAVTGASDFQGSVADSTGNLTIADSTVITGTLDLQGTLSDSNGDLIFPDNLDITGYVYDGGSDLELYDSVHVTGSVTVTADLIVDDVFNIDDTSYTLTGSQTLNPTASFYVINSAGVVTITLGTTGVQAGDFLVLNNISGNNAVIADTNVRTTTGAALTLGQYDVVAFVYNGAAWIELYLAANS